MKKHPEEELPREPAEGPELEEVKREAAERPRDRQVKATQSSEPNPLDPGGIGG